MKRDLLKHRDLLLLKVSPVLTTFENFSKSLTRLYFIFAYLAIYLLQNTHARGDARGA